MIREPSDRTWAELLDTLLSPTVLDRWASVTGKRALAAAG